MSADWAVGDLALCVDAGHCAPIIQQGRVYRVRFGPYVGARGIVYLALCGVAEGREKPGFAVNRFRKIRPDEHEACEPEFVTLLKRRKVPLTRETAEQIRRWRQEDADNGIIWEDSTKGRERQRFGDNPLPSDR